MRTKRWTTIVMAAALLLSVSRPAHAQLASVSAVNPDTGFPQFYTDTKGLSLDLCLTPPTIVGGVVMADPCLLAGFIPHPAAPISFPDNFPVELHYWSADALIKTPPVTAKLIMTLGAGFLTPTPMAGQQRTFSRIRISITGLQPGGSFTITHPFGTLTTNADLAGNIITRKLIPDVGCAVVPCDFTIALGQAIPTPPAAIGPFLTWDPAVAPAAPVHFIGDPIVTHTVVGGVPNMFIVEGPGLVNDPACPHFNAKPALTVPCLQTELFTVSGKIAGPMALKDVATTVEGSPVTIPVLANDTALAGTVITPATVAIATPAAHGTAVANPDGTVTYTPAAAFFGTDAFAYTVGDSAGNVSNPAKVTVTVTPLAPAAGGLTITRAVLGRFSLLVMGTDANGDTSVQIFAGSAPPGPSCAGMTQIGTRRVILGKYRFVMSKLLLRRKLGGVLPSEVCVMGTPSGASAAAAL